MHLFFLFYLTLFASLYFFAMSFFHFTLVIADQFVVVVFAWFKSFTYFYWYRFVDKMVVSFVVAFCWSLTLCVCICVGGFFYLNLCAITLFTDLDVDSTTRPHARSICSRQASPKIPYLHLWKVDMHSNWIDLPTCARHHNCRHWWIWGKCEWSQLIPLLHFSGAILVTPARSCITHSFAS